MICSGLGMTERRILIAAGLSPFAPERAAMQAGRLMLQGIDAAVEKQTSFAFETTLSGRGYARKIPVWQSMGYHVSLYFLRPETVDIAIERVAERVRQGGHDVPEAVIRRRYISGWTNFRETYMNLVNDWVVFDNTDRKPKPLSRSDER